MTCGITPYTPLHERASYDILHCGLDGTLCHQAVVGVESRGFIFGAPLAYLLNCGFVPVRKFGKLPSKTVTVEYALEYGTNVVEMHTDAIKPGQRVLIVDDLLATGGTVSAAMELVEKLGGHIAGIAFLVELTFLKGREQLKG